MRTEISKKNISEGIPFEAKEQRTTARNNSWTAGTNLKSTEVLGGKYANFFPPRQDSATVLDRVVTPLKQLR